MIKGSEIRKADYPIEPVLIDRWSPRAMSGEEISREELMRLFEAARWAPSSFNAQQWRALYARRGTEQWQTVARRDRKNCYLKSYKPAKVRMIGGRFPRAFSRDNSGLNRNSA